MKTEKEMEEVFENMRQTLVRVISESQVAMDSGDITADPAKLKALIECYIMVNRIVEGAV